MIDLTAIQKKNPSQPNELKHFPSGRFSRKPKVISPRHSFEFGGTILSARSNLSENSFEHDRESIYEMMVKI